jgi:adenosylhomocysteine nucleosidase
MKVKTLIVVALEDEFEPSNLVEGTAITYTGVGKVNAAMKLAKVLSENQIEKVINYGTAGGSDESQVGKLFGISRICERDMDTQPLGTAKYQTPGEDHVWIETANHNARTTLGTGDSFAEPNEDYELVDMEAYALAKVCKEFNIPFYCYKYVSDTGSADDWKENVKKGEKLFRMLLT